jgi:hypothetical protein
MAGFDNDSLDGIDLDVASVQVAGDLGFDLGDGEDSTPEVSEPAPTETPTPEVPAPAPAPAPAPVPDASSTAQAPRTWKKEAAALWQSIPPAVQAEIARREEDMFRGLEQYRTNAQVGERWSQVIAPFQQIYQAHGIDIAQQTQHLLNAHVMLATTQDKAQRAQMFRQVLEGYGMTVEELAGLPPVEQAFVDPQVAGLTQQLHGLQSTVQSLLQQRDGELRSQISAEVNTFADAHEHFELVADSMVELMKSGLAQDLEAAYEKACLLSPEVRQLEETKRTAASAPPPQEVVSRAKAATAANVKGTPRQGGTAPKGGNWAENLDSLYDDITNR